MFGSPMWLYIVTIVLILLVPTVGFQLGPSQKSNSWRRKMGVFPSKNHFPVDGRVSPFKLLSRQSVN